jgi:hypothetical protein
MKKLHPEFIYLSGDEEAKKLSIAIVEILKKDKFFFINKNISLSDYTDKLLFKIWLSLFKKYSKNKVVIVDDIYRNIKHYYYELKYKKRLILLGLEFDKLYNNLISRKNTNTRIPAIILEDVIEIYRLSDFSMIGKTKFYCGVSLNWSKDSKYLLGAVLSPRVRVDNEYKLFTYNGEEILCDKFNEYNIFCIDSCVKQ